MGTKSVAKFDLKAAWQPYTCKSVQEYLQKALGRLDQREGRYAFRGVTRHFPNIWPSIDRRDTASGDLIEIETDLLKEFLRRAWAHLTLQEQQRCLLAGKRWGDKRNTGAMIVARHRTVPTRCVDWTDEPLYSLLFACEADSACNGEVWWFNRTEFHYCVGAQWPALFGKPRHVEDDIEREFIAGTDTRWFTAFRYMSLAGDRLDLQKGWITVGGRLGTCHAEEIHRLGVRGKGRLVIPAHLKAEAMAFLGKMGITRDSLGFAQNDPADRIAERIKEDFERRFPPKR
jgi:hypothetical protein